MVVDDEVPSAADSVLLKRVTIDCTTRLVPAERGIPLTNSWLASSVGSSSLMLAKRDSRRRRLSSRSTSCISTIRSLGGTATGSGTASSKFSLISAGSFVLSGGGKIFGSTLISQLAASDGVVVSIFVASSVNKTQF